MVDGGWKLDDLITYVWHARRSGEVGGLWGSGTPLRRWDLKFPIEFAKN